jgi:hypothetical protein
MGEPQRDKLTAAALKVKYKYASTEEFIREASKDISLFGIFIDMKSPLKEGLTLQLEFELEDGSPIIQGLGQVVWRREIAQSDDRPSGIGVKFLKLEPVSREIVERAVEMRGSAPSRFDRLGDAAARASIHERASAPLGPWESANADKLLSTSRDSDSPASASVPVNTKPPRFSFTRVKTVTVPNQADEPRAQRQALSDEVEAHQTLLPAEPTDELSAPTIERPDPFADWGSSEHPEPFRPAQSTPPAELKDPFADWGSSEHPEPFQPAQSAPPAELKDPFADWGSSEHPEPFQSAQSAPPTAPEEARRYERDQIQSSQPPAKPMTALPDAPKAAEPPLSEASALPRVESNPVSSAPPAPPAAQRIPQGEAKDIGTITPTASDGAKRDETSEPEAISQRMKVSMLRERLAKQSASERPPASFPELAPRVGRLTKLSQTESEQYGAHRRLGQPTLRVDELQHRRFQAVTRKSGRGIMVVIKVMLWVLLRTWRLLAEMLSEAVKWIREGSEGRRRALRMGAFLLLLIVSGVSAYRALTPKTWRSARVLKDETNQALVNAGAELHRNAEELGLAQGSTELSEPTRTTERPTRYLLIVMTRPAGATVAVGNRRFLTPGELELERPDGALRIAVRKRSYQTVQRRITSADFQIEGEFFIYTLEVQLEKQSSRTKQTETPPTSTPTSKKKFPSFYLEPMPDLP